MLTVSLGLAGAVVVNTRPVSALTVTKSDDVQVQAIVEGCTLSITAHPEKRWPRVGNWDTYLTVKVYDTSDNFIGEYTDLSDEPNGTSTVDFCEVTGVTPPPGNYRFFVRGYSHLYRDFGINYAFGGGVTALDFSTGGRILYAGETSNVFDNKINSLDISTQINTLYDTNDLKNDFNQDGEVNSLEIGNTIDNFYMLGDFPP